MLLWRARAKPLGVGRRWLIMVLCVRVAFTKFGLSVLYSCRSTYRVLCTEGYEGKHFPFWTFRNPKL